MIGLFIIGMFIIGMFITGLFIIGLFIGFITGAIQQLCELNPGGLQSRYRIGDV